MKKIDLYKFCEKTKTVVKPLFRGIFYKNGFMYATDGFILFKIKGSYYVDYENKVVDKKGNIIDGTNYIDCDMFFNDCNIVGTEIPYEKFKPIFKEYNKVKHNIYDICNCYINNHAYYNMNKLKQFVDACETRNMKIYCSQTSDTYKALIGKNELGEYGMLMNVLAYNNSTIYNITK